MANMDRSDAQRLKQLDAIEDKLKQQKQYLKDIKDGTAEVVNKEKAIQGQLNKINLSLKEQIELKKIINAQNDKEIKIVTALNDYQTKVANTYKKATPEVRKQLEAQGGILDQTEQIETLAHRAKNLTGEQGDLYAEMAVISMDIGDAGLDNLSQQKNIGKEAFKQVDLKEKLHKIQELENQLQNTNFKDAAIGEDRARQQAEDALNMIKKQYGDEKALFDMREQEHGAMNTLMEQGDSLMGGMLSKGKKLIETLAKNPLAGFVLIFGMAAREFTKQISAVGDAFGAVAVQDEKFTRQLLANAAQAKQIGKEMSDVVAVVKSLTSEFGLNNQEAEILSNSILDTGKALSLSNEEAVKLIAGIKTVTGLSMEQADVFAKQVTLLAQQAGAAPDQVLKDIANSSETVAKFTDATGENIAKAAIQAQKLGLSLDKVGGIAEGLLDFQTSIGKEIELSVLLGRQLNFQRARELALSNDLEGMMNEVVKQLGSEEELLRMNVIQRKAIADMLGISSSDLSKMVDNQGKQLTLTQGLVTALGLQDLVGGEALANLDKLTNAFVSFAAFVAETLIPALEPLFFILDQTIGNLLRMASMIKGVLLPALTAWASYQAIVAYQVAATVSASTLGLGIAAIIGGVATWNAWTGSNKPRRYQNLPMGEGVNIQSGTAIADAGESIVHTTDLGAGSKEVVDAIGGLKGELVAMKNALSSLELRTSISNKDLNIVMTPKNA